MKKAISYYSEFGYYIHQVVMLLDKQGDALFHSKLGISLRQFMLLRLFEVSPTIPSQQLIAQRLGIAKSAVSRHITIAQERGWIIVKLSAQSRRQNTLELTATGKELLRRAKALIRVTEAQGFRDISYEDIEATLRTLKHLNNKLQ